jgi:hypothetical protein
LFFFSETGAKKRPPPFSTDRGSNPRRLSKALRQRLLQGFFNRRKKGKTMETLSTSKAELQAQLKQIREAEIAALPVATDAQLARVLRAVGNEEPSPEGFVPNVDFKLSDLQKSLVKAARARRKAYLAQTEVKEAVMASLKDEDAILVSYKVRITSKGVTRTASTCTSMESIIDRLSGGDESWKK